MSRQPVDVAAEANIHTLYSVDVLPMLEKHQTQTRCGDHE